MTEEEARALVNAELPSSVTEHEWGYLVGKDWISDLMLEDVHEGEDEYATSPATIAEEILSIRQAALPDDVELSNTAVQQPPSVRKHGKAPATSKRSRALRMRALALLLAAEARGRDDVLNFEAERLEPPVVMTEEDVLPWLQRQAERDQGPTSMWITEAFVQPGQRDLIQSALERDFEAFEYDEWGQLLPFNVQVSVNPGQLAHQLVYRTLRCTIRDPETGQEGVYEQVTRIDGVLEELRALSWALAHDYGWDEAEAARFVLTGIPPQVHDVTEKITVNRWHPSTSRIALYIDPVLLPEEVAEAYQLVRKQILTKRSTRRISERHLQLACFMASRKSWETMETRRKTWNKQYPDWRFDEVRKLRRAWREVQKNLLQPQFRQPRDATLRHDATE